jgi:hypothetical protein
MQGIWKTKYSARKEETRTGLIRKKDKFKYFFKDKVEAYLDKDLLIENNSSSNDYYKADKNSYKIKRILETPYFKENKSFYLTVNFSFYSKEKKENLEAFSLNNYYLDITKISKEELTYLFYNGGKYLFQNNNLFERYGYGRISDVFGNTFDSFNFSNNKYKRTLNKEKRKEKSIFILFKCLIDSENKQSLENMLEHNSISLDMIYINQFIVNKTYEKKKIELKDTSLCYTNQFILKEYEKTYSTDIDSFFSFDKEYLDEIKDTLKNDIIETQNQINYPFIGKLRREKYIFKGKQISHNEVFQEHGKNGKRGSFFRKLVQKRVRQEENKNIKRFIYDRSDMMYTLNTYYIYHIEEGEYECKKYLLQNKHVNNIDIPYVENQKSIAWMVS